MGRGKTIQIFLPDGSAKGIKLAEITSAIEKAILIPRNNLQEATKSFTKTHIEFLEELTIRNATEANRFEFENNVSTKHYEIPESLKADLLDSFDTIKF